MTRDVGLAGIGLWGPGLPGWAVGRAVLRGEVAAPDDQPPPAPAILPDNERRRASLATRLALAAAGEAIQGSGFDPAAGLPALFASANGDGATVCGLLDSIATGGDVSPTAFHNSVHNAGAGYWSIGVGAGGAITCLGCGDDTGAAALLHGVAAVLADTTPLLVCLYDAPLPPPMDAKRPMVGALGAALVLTPAPGRLGRLSVDLCDGPPEGPTDAPGPAALHAPALHALTWGNPAGRWLPLLERIARAEAGSARLPYQDGALVVRFDP